MLLSNKNSSVERWAISKTRNTGAPEQHQSGTRNTGTPKILNLLRFEKKVPGGVELLLEIIA